MTYHKSKAFLFIFLFAAIMFVTIFGLMTATVPTAVAAPTADSCFISINNSGTTDYSSADASALQTAVNAASPDDTLKIAGICAGVQQTSGITQTAYIDINLILQGGYTNTNWLATPDPSSYPTVLDAEDGGRVVYIPSGKTVTLDSLIIQNGNSTDAGGGIANWGVLTVTNSQILSNTATNYGGGIDNDSYDLTISNSLIRGNSANRGGGINNYVGTMTIISTTLEHNQANSSEGGAISNDAGSLNLIDSLLQHNQAATNGGGYYAGATSGNGTVISNSHVYSNTATQGGGGFLVGQSLVVTNSILSENYSGDKGGAGYLSSSAEASFYASQILSNTATTQGGGLMLTANDGVLTVTLSTLSGNQAGTKGGGLYVNGDNTEVLLDETTVYSNRATGVGGGIFNRNADTTVLNSKILSNTAVSHGGGIWHENNGTVTVNGSELKHNRAANGGALANNWSVQYVITNSLFSHNYASSNGGAIWIINNDDGLTQIANSTVYSNTAGGQGGGIFNDIRSTMYITDTLVSYNQANTSGGGIHTDKLLILHGGQIISNSVTSSSGDGGGLYLGNINAIVTQTGVLTLAYNLAADKGGGVYVANGRLTMDGARILGNQAGSTGGGIYQNGYTKSITVTNSCLVFNSDTAVFYHGGPVLSATGNWWGGSDGPSEAGSGHGDSVSTISNIDISGWLTTAPVDCPAYTPILTITGGDNQATEINQPFSQPLSVTLNMDNDGLPFAGEVITFTGPSSGAGIAPTVLTATTNVDGLAVVTPTANSNWGNYEVVVSADVDSQPITFTLQNYTYFTLSTVSAGNGTVTSVPAGIGCGADCSESYENGTVVTLTAVSGTGSTFSGWSGACTNTSGDCVVTMTQAENVTATFTLNQYALTVVVAGAGAGSVTSDPAGIDCGANCSESYDHGTAMTLTAVADSGSTFIGWSGDCTNASGDCVITMSEAKTVTATFVKVEYKIYLPIIIKP